MALVRWEPFQEFEDLQNRMNRLFDSLAPTGQGDIDGISFRPAAEMHETEDAIHLKLEVPGLKAEDIDIQASADSISISGERKSETETENGGIKRSEFRYGKFQRAISLPSRIQHDKVEANYDNGILALTLPKAEEERNKVVKVNVG
jgi:HSP20 family protein